jgi:DNA-binding NarL/FixJ family response regulator
MVDHAILIVDDHPMMREALQLGIEQEDGFCVVGSAANGLDAVQQAVALKPDLILMDLFLPGMDGVTAMKTIRETLPTLRVLFLSSSYDEEDIVRAVAAGADGYLQKSQSRSVVIQAIRDVLQGKKYFPLDIAEKLADAIYHKSDNMDLLTEREKQVLDLLGDVITYDLLAQHLSISESTIRVHVFNICSKLGIANRTELVLFAARRKSSKRN